MGYVDVIQTAVTKADLPINRNSGYGEAFDKALKDARKKTSGRRDIVNGVLNKTNLTAGTADGSYSFKRASQGATEMTETVNLAKTSLPSSYQKQLGVGMMVMGQSDLSSMVAGASLTNCSSSVEALREIFGNLGAARAHLKLDRAALGDLSQVLADSGLGDEEIDNFLANITAGNMTIEEIYAHLEKLDLKSEGNKGLTATENGLAALGQFLNGLGASSEAVNSLTSGFMEGDQLTAADLRQILSVNDEALMAPCLNQTDIYNLASTLRSLGLSQNNINSLFSLQSQNNGQMSLNDVLNFVEGLENTPARTVTGEEMKLVKNILDNISREQELVKLPVFDETLVKLQALGDQDIDDDFMRLSPALQALRGGISGASQNAAFGGQSGQQGRNGQQHDGRESKEQLRQAVYASNGEYTPAAAAETVEAVQGYGGQESLVRQISQKIAYSHRRGLHRLKMNLNPADMGRLDIELKVQGDQLVAHIRAENRETYEALAEDIESLKTALAESGLEISNLTLAFDDQATGRTEFADLRPPVERSLAADEYIPGENASNAYQGSVYRVI